MRITFVGHAGFLLESRDGKRLLIDPWFTHSRLWRVQPPALSADEVGHIDFLLVSHNHIDHVDRGALALARACGATVVGSRRVARRARAAACTRAIGLTPGERFTDDALTIIGTPAWHPLSGLFGDGKPLGLLIEIEGLRMYYTGDTRLHDALIAELRRAGQIDAMFVQIACAWYFTDDGLRVETAAELAQLIRPKLTIPMHYHGRGKTADPYALVRALEPHGLAVRVLATGEAFDLLKENPS